jgi:hypothetical protein
MPTKSEWLRYASGPWGHELAIRSLGRDETPYLVPLFGARGVERASPKPYCGVGSGIDGGEGSGTGTGPGSGGAPGDGSGTGSGIGSGTGSGDGSGTMAGPGIVSAREWSVALTFR